MTATEPRTFPATARLVPVPNENGYHVFVGEFNLASIWPAAGLWFANGYAFDSLEEAVRGVLDAPIPANVQVAS